MFCPNCGTQNPDTAQTCSKCNFHLKSVAAPKFKGTMLMMNQPGTVPVVPPPQGPGQVPQQQQPNTQRTGLAGSAPPPGGAGGMPMANRLKGTMVGVAPMANPAARPMNAPVAVPSPGGPPMGGPGMGGPMQPMHGQPMQPMHGQPMGGQPMQPMGGQPMAPTIGIGGPPMGGPVPQAPRTPPPPGGQELSFSPPVPQGGVNPLGGTVAADGSAFNQFGGPPPGGMPYGAPPPQGTALMPGVGAAPPYAQYGAPPGHAPSGPPQYDPGAMGGMPPSPYGAPQANPFAGPPPGYSSQPPAGGYGAPGPQAMMPYGQGPAPLVPGLASLSPTATTTGPTRRNALMTLLVPYGILFGANLLTNILVRILPALAILGSLVSLGGTVLLLWLLFVMAREVKTVTRNDSFVPWHVIIPFYNCYVLWILVPQEVTKAKQLLGVQQPTRSIWLYIFLTPFALASDVNDMVR